MSLQKLSLLAQETIRPKGPSLLAQEAEFLQAHVMVEVLEEEFNEQGLCGCV